MLPSDALQAKFCLVFSHHLRIDYVNKCFVFLSFQIRSTDVRVRCEYAGLKPESKTLKSSFLFDNNALEITGNFDGIIENGYDECGH